MCEKSFQLTHSRGVRPEWLYLLDAAGGISTHALTWSATVSGSASPAPITISTHALTWSATRRIFQQCKGLRQFQLAHSRGVRQLMVCFLPADKNFNSRTHVECDAVNLVFVFYFVHFNSRTHVECDIRKFSKRTDH